MNQSKQQAELRREEQLSSILDSALDEAQLTSFMQDLKRDPVDDAETAQRYRLMGDSMRDELDQASFMDISSAVSRAIEQEPSHSEGGVVLQNYKPASAFNLGEWFNRLLKPVAGVAVAVSVATVTLVTFNTVSNESSTSNVQLAQSSSVESAKRVSVQAVNPDIARNVRIASTMQVAKKSPQQQKQLNVYMLQHSGYASQSTMQGMMPYVRAADVKTREQD
jgi:sigma-E factor negative regulatory protein RseA